jgi:hypothetical protein
MSKHTKHGRRQSFLRYIAWSDVGAHSTDGPTPPPCSQDIYRNGVLVFMTHGIGGSNAIERWVKSIAKASGQPVDWHFAGGRVCVLALGDLAKVREAVRSAMPEHDRLYRTKAMSYDYVRGSPEAYIHYPRPAWWNDDATPEPFTAPRVVTGPGGGMVLIDPEAAAIINALR